MTRFNKANGTDFRFVRGDTQLNPANAPTVASKFHSNPSIIGIVGPAGSQEIAGRRADLPGASTSRSSRCRPPALAHRGTTQSRTRRSSASCRTTTCRARRTPNYMPRRRCKPRASTWSTTRSSYSTGLADRSSRPQSKGVTVERDSVDQKADRTSRRSSSKIGTPTRCSCRGRSRPTPQLFAEQMQEQGKKATI